MRYNWTAILGGLAGGVLAGLVAAYASTQMLDEGTQYASSDILWAALVAAVGGILGVVLGWFVNGRRARGLGGIAALTSLFASLVGTFAWAQADGRAEETWPYLVGVILMLGLSLIMLAAVCGLTAAVLRQQSAVEGSAGQPQP